MSEKKAKPWWESKTIWLNLAIAAVGVAELATDALKPIVPPEAMGVALAAVAAANVVLRAVTGSPVCGSKPPPEPPKLVS